MGVGRCPAPRRKAFFPDLGWVDIPSHRSAELTPGTVVEGPGVVAEETSTIVVHPGTRLTVTAQGNYLLEVGSRA